MIVDIVLGGDRDGGVPRALFLWRHMFVLGRSILLLCRIESTMAVVREK